MPIATTTMPRATVLGAGVIGMTIALELSKTHKVIVLARDLPGDPDSKMWASPWAGAMWWGLDGASLEQQRMQKMAFDKFMELSETRPETSIKKITGWDYQEKYTQADDPALWYTFLPNFRHMTEDEVGGIGIGLKFDTVVMTPEKYLAWLKVECEGVGVIFRRDEVRSLAQAATLQPCDVLINAASNGNKFLSDVADDNCLHVRGQMLLVKGDCPDIHSKHTLDWKDFTYVTPRGDGTMLIGGIKEYGCTDPNPYEWLNRSIHERCRKLVPKYIPEKYEDLEILKVIVGIRPERKGGIRLEKEVLHGINVVHAYGMTGGGYVFSWGIAEKVVKLANSYLITEQSDVTAFESGNTPELKTPVS